MKPLEYRLTVVLKDGRKLSGSYPYLLALARQEAALKLPQTVSAVVEDA